MRYRNYNEVLDYIDELEAKGDAIVIRPQKKMEVGRTTNDRKKLSALYDEGYAVGDPSSKTTGSISKHR